MSYFVYAKRFSEERARLGYDLKQVGVACGCSWQAVYNWEVGRNTPSFAALILLTKIGYDIGFILTGKRALTMGVDTEAKCT